MASDLRVAGRPAIGILDHEVGVHREDPGLDDGLSDREPPRQVRHEMVVHDVDVGDVGSGDLREFAAQVGDVAVQDRRANCGVHNAYASACAGTPQT